MALLFSEGDVKEINSFVGMLREEFYTCSIGERKSEDANFVGFADVGVPWVRSGECQAFRKFAHRPRQFPNMALYADVGIRASPFASLSELSCVMHPKRYSLCLLAIICRGPVWIRCFNCKRFGGPPAHPRFWGF